MKAMNLVLLAITALFLAGCPHDVNLTVKNPTNRSLEAQVSIDKSSGVQVQQIDLGTLQPNQETTQKFKIDDNNEYVVTANLLSSATIFSQKKTVTPDDPKEITASVSLAINAAMLDSNTAVQRISDAFNNLGPQIGFNPLPINSGLQTLYGGLLVIVPQVGQDTGDRVAFQLTPAQFGSQVIPPDSFQWPGSNTQNTVDVDSDVTAKVGASVPLFSQVSASFDQSSVYNVQWNLLGYGMVQKPEAAGWNYQTAFSQLSGAVKQQLCNALMAPSSFVIYVNKFYVIQNASFSLKKASKIALHGDVSGGIVNASGAWTYSNSIATLQQFQNSVLNIDGVKWSNGGISCAAPQTTGSGTSAAAAGAVAPPPPSFEVKVKGEPNETFHLTTKILKQVQSVM